MHTLKSHPDFILRLANRLIKANINFDLQYQNRQAIIRCANKEVLDTEARQQYLEDLRSKG